MQILKQNHEKEIEKLKSGTERYLSKQKTKQIKIQEEEKTKRMLIVFDNKLSLEEQKFKEKDINRLRVKRKNIKGTKN